MTFIKLMLFVLLPGGIFICAIMFAWDQVKRFDDQEDYYEEEISKLKAEIVELERIEAIKKGILYHKKEQDNEIYSL